MPIPLKSAVVLGATGLVGRRLLHALTSDAECTRVVTIGRRPTGLVASTLTEVTADLAEPETYRAYLKTDCVFCALGTTLKKSGSEEAFRRVDHDYPLIVAREALAAGARRYALVSAVGADSTSRVFYNRVKGELEDALRGLPFPSGVRILHPSVLLGERNESRPAEQIAAAFMRVTGPLFGGGLKKYRAISADDVARALITAARSDGDGAVTYEGEPLFAAARR